MGPAHGTLVFRGTVVGNHCSKQSIYNGICVRSSYTFFSCLLNNKFKFSAPFNCSCCLSIPSFQDYHFTFPVFCRPLFVSSSISNKVFNCLRPFTTVWQLIARTIWSEWNSSPCKIHCQRECCDLCQLINPNYTTLIIFK